MTGKENPHPNANPQAQPNTVAGEGPAFPLCAVGDSELSNWDGHPDLGRPTANDMLYATKLMMEPIQPDSPRTRTAAQPTEE